MSDVILPFPVLLMTIVAVVVSFMLILENQNSEQQCKQLKHFTVMVAPTKAGTKRTNEEVDIDDTRRSKQRVIKYDNEDTKRCIVFGLTEFRQPLQVQSHLEMPGILVQLGHIQHT